MSDASERPDADSDAWATAAAEDLAAEKARRRQEYGQPPGSAAEELRKLVDAVADKVSSLQNPLLGMVGQGAVQQFINQAKAAVEPVIERNPAVFDHLAAAGTELLAAYRTAVENQESRWTQGPGAPSGDAAPDDTGDTGNTGRTARTSDAEPGGTYDMKKSDDPTDPRDEGPGPDGHIDLD
ncbi:DUF5304 domain-containing protein [Streptomyces sp. NPDC088725]|uniref:DUF5304 domain-containing protein n=1 Tax=Streptomyces sp. NPDC088725 TaxID=3365873 RepID=UPI0037FCC494